MQLDGKDLPWRAACLVMDRWRGVVYGVSYGRIKESVS